MSDAYECSDCEFEFSGYNRPPPYHHCPKCEDGYMKKIRGNNSEDTITFSGPVEMVHHIYDRCVEPGMTNDERIALMGVISARVVDIWPELEEEYKND